VEKSQIIDGWFPAEIKADRGRQQNKQRESRFDEFSEIAQEMSTRGRDCWVFDYRGFHAGIGFGAL
jgi:hypothetical protein